jgi:PPOX class probable F420-dependent enzyme
MNTLLTQFQNQLYLNLETFRKDGESMKTPVWFVLDGEKIYIRTVSNSGKVKRIHHNGQVNIAVCDSDGRPCGEWISAQAAEASDVITFTRAIRIIDDKYGDLAKMYESQTHAKGLEYTVIEIKIEA